MNVRAHEPPDPVGVDVERLTPERIDAVLADVFDHGVRCRELDRALEGSPPGPQWLLAEFGDGRVTGACPRQSWRRSDGDVADRWRILEVLVFAAHAQIRLGEGAGSGWIATDRGGDLPEWLRPRDRSFLLQGWVGAEHRSVLDGEVPMTITREPSGAEAVLPVTWTEFSGRLRPLAEPGRSALESTGTWLTVREYWAADPATGAVGVAFHRLTGMCAGPKPTGPEFEVGTGDRIEER